MLDEAKPDLLDIVTEPASHLPLIRLAAERKIATICQKPFCRSLAEATEATRVAVQSNTLLVVHENFRFQPWYREIKRLIEDGAIGDCYQATFRLRPGDGQGPGAYLDRQPYFQRMERFLVHETAIHFIDTFRYLVGEIESVFADLRRLNPVIKGEDAGLIVFRHRNGVRSLFDGNRLVDHAASDPRLTLGEMLVEGSAASLRLDGDGLLLRRAHGANAETMIEYPCNRNGYAGDSVLRLQRHVIEHLLDRGPVFNSARDYLANLRIEEAIYLSATTGATQHLPNDVPT
jgi:D-apiose dehydrogenase